MPLIFLPLWKNSHKKSENFENILARLEKTPYICNRFSGNGELIEILVR